MSLLPSGLAVYEDGRGWQFYNSAGQALLGAGGSPNGLLDNYGITGSLAESVDRSICPEVNNAAPTATGTLYMQSIWLPAGITVSNLSWCSATTAAGTPTHYMIGLYDINRNLLATSTDQTSTAWAANTLKTFAMTVPYLVPTSGLYYVGFFMAATTVITSKGGTAKTNGALAATVPILHGASSSTGLTTALPNPAGAITAGLLPIWTAVT